MKKLMISGKVVIFKGDMATRRAQNPVSRRKIKMPYRRPDDHAIWNTVSQRVLLQNTIGLVILDVLPPT